MFHLKQHFLVCISIALILISIFSFCIIELPNANYIWKAYFYPGSSSNLHGYPTIAPPNNFTGEWVDYSFSGQPIAIHNYIDGHPDGMQTYLRDDGTPYLIRYIQYGKWLRDDINLGPPSPTTIPWYFPQRWINRSLNRLAIIDKLFPQKPDVLISVEKSQK